VPSQVLEDVSEEHARKTILKCVCVPSQVLEDVSEEHARKTILKCVCVPSQVLEDVSEEHARKTITLDPHPNLSMSAASIHPCRHAGVC